MYEPTKLLEFPRDSTIGHERGPHESAPGGGNVPDGIAGTPHLAKEASSLCETQLWERSRVSRLRTRNLPHAGSPQRRHGTLSEGAAQRAPLGFLCHPRSTYQPSTARAECRTAALWSRNARSGNQLSFPTTLSDFKQPRVARCNVLGIRLFSVPRPMSVQRHHRSRRGRHQSHSLRVVAFGSGFTPSTNC